MRSALIYCRVSSDRQATEGHGLDSQEHRCREFARTHDLEVEKVFRDSFTGGGDFMNRPAMAELLAYLDSNLPNEYVIVFDDLKRFARDTVFHIKLRAAFKARKTTLMCLNFNFDESPTGKFVETMMAATGELEREQNRLQVIQKMKARLEKGYWPFYPPPGYEFQKNSVHGKVLVPLEPNASLIKEAFEGFASDRFETQTDVMNFLRTSGYRGGIKDKPIYVEGVRRLLRRVVYAGYIQREEWDVSRRKAYHTPLISLEVFEKVQAKIDGYYKTRVRRTDNPDFALRGFVLCHCCKKKLTASWARGRTKRYPYFRCNTSICSRYNKNINAALIEEGFLSTLRLVSPREETVNLVKAVLLDLWGKRIHSLDGQRAVLERTLFDIKKQVDSLTDRVTRALEEKIVQVYEQKISRLENDRLLAEEQLARIGVDIVQFETALEVVTNFLKDPYSIWVNGDLNAKRLVLRLIFADKLAFHPTDGFETAEKSLFIGLFEQVSAKESQDVEVGRIELPSESVIESESTTRSSGCPRWAEIRQGVKTRAKPLLSLSLI